MPIARRGGERLVVADGSLDQPTAREHEGPERDQGVRSRQARVAGSVAVSGESDRRVRARRRRSRRRRRRSRPPPAPGAARRRRPYPPGSPSPWTVSIGALSSTPAAKPRHDEQHLAGAAGRPRRGQQVDGAEGEPGHVEHGAEEVEDPEGAVVPAGGGARRQGGRGQGEHPQGEGPGPVLGPVVPGVAHEHRLREQRRHRRRHECQCHHHSPERMTPKLREKKHKVGSLVTRPGSTRPPRRQSFPTLGAFRRRPSLACRATTGHSSRPPTHRSARCRRSAWRSWQG